jgi:hypothetical protein
MGSLSHWIAMLARFIGARVSGESAIDHSDTRIDRQRRIVGLVLLIIFLLLPALFILFSDYLL